MRKILGGICMNKTIIELMEKEIISLIEELSMYDPGSEEYKEISKAIDGLYVTLNKEKSLALEETKLEKTSELEEKTHKDNRVMGYVKTGVELASIVVPVIFYGIWMKRGLEFEQEGSYTSATFKGLVSKFKTTK
jgi:glutaredoxin